MNLTAMKDAIERRSGALMTIYAWQGSPNKPLPDREAWGTITLDGEAAAVWGDNGQAEQALEGSVHLFCRGIETTAPVGVQTALNELGVSWRLDYVRYEENTRLIHYEWIWSDWGGL